jgi:hypothetical protein
MEKPRFMPSRSTTGRRGRRQLAEARHPAAFGEGIGYHSIDAHMSKAAISGARSGFTYSMSATTWRRQPQPV